MERVQKLISDFGYCSRRKAEELIKKGLVKVDGEVITLGAKATKDAIIEINGVILEKKDKIYLLVNKPRFLAASINQKQKSLYHILPSELRSYNVLVLNPLAYEEEGLIILTNDKDLEHKYAKSNRKAELVYEITFKKKIEQKDLDQLIKGLKYKDQKLNFQILKIKVNKEKNATTLLVKTLAHKDLKIFSLFKENGILLDRSKRISIDRLSLTLLENNYRPLTPHEVKILYSL